MKRLITFFLATCCIIACSDGPEDIQPSTDQNDLQISLTVNPDSLPADGTTYREVKVTISGAKVGLIYNANLAINPIGKFNNNNQTISVGIDGSGSGNAYIYSDSPGLATLTASVGVKTITRYFKFYKAQANDIILSLTQNNIPADNFTYAEIGATALNNPYANNQITFVTDKGIFSNDSSTYTIQASSTNTTYAYLKYNKVDIARVTATIYNTFSKEIYVTFVNAPPEQIAISPDSGSIPSFFNSNAAITATLWRSAGTPSEGQMVHFYDSTTIGSSVGIFSAITNSDSVGVASSTFWIQDTSYHGYLYIKGLVNTGNGGFVFGSNKIFIQ